MDILTENEGDDQNGSDTTMENKGDVQTVPALVTRQDTFVTCRSRRTVRPSLKAMESNEKFPFINPNYSSNIARAYTAAYLQDLLPDDSINLLHPITYVSSLADKDSLTFNEALAQSDRDEFI